MLHAYATQWFALGFAGPSIMADDDPARLGILRNPNFIPNAFILKVASAENFCVKFRIASDISFELFEIMPAEVFVKNDAPIKRRHRW